MDVVISTDRIEFSTRTFAYGVQGTEIVKVSYARIQQSTPNWYEVYVDRKNGERIVIDLRTTPPSFPAWTNTQAGAEQAVIDITAVAGVCCDGGGGGVGIVELTGDVLAGPGTGTVPAVLATIGAFAGSYTDPILTVDNKGRVTAITSGPGDDHLVLASVTDTTPGTLIDKIEIVNATAAIINGGADEILRFTPSGGGGGTGAFPIALYRDAGVNTLPMDGSWLDIVLSVALQTAADIVRTGAEFEFQSDGTYFVGFKMTADTGASRAQHKVRLVVDAGGGYSEVDSSIGYTFTPNTSDDLQMAYTGLIPIVAVAGDKIKAQGAASSGTVDIDTLGAGTAIVIFRMQTDAGATEFTQLTDVPNSYVGQALLSVRVNAAETGLEFFAGGGGSGITELTGDVAAGPGSGSQAATIQPGVVDNTKLDSMASQTFKGRVTVGAGDPEDLDADDASDILDGAADPFVRTSNLPPDTGITELTGDVTAGPGSGSQVATIAADSVTNAKLDNVPAATFKGSPVGAGTVNPIDLTADQASTILDSATDPFIRTSTSNARYMSYGVATAAQGPGFATDTLIVGSAIAIPSGGLKAGTAYRLRCSLNKTAAGTATPIFQVRLGTTGTTADTSRTTITFGAGTAAADLGFLELMVTFRSVGAGTSAVIISTGVISHTLNTTGLTNGSYNAIAGATSAGFDSTADTFICVSLNAGTSAAWTIGQVHAQLFNMA